MKKIICLTIALALLVSATACGNKQFLDTTYTFDQAIISLPDGTIIKGKVTSWKDYDDGDQIQIKINGTTYLVHSTNVALIAN